MLVGMGNPLGTRNPHGYGFGQNFIPVMGMGFLAGVFFLRGYGFGQVIPSGFLPIAISMQGGSMPPLVLPSVNLDCPSYGCYPDCPSYGPYPAQIYNLHRSMAAAMRLPARTATLLAPWAKSAHRN
jgi:hypothetical protein